MRRQPPKSPRCFLRTGSSGRLDMSLDDTLTASEDAHRAIWDAFHGRATSLGPKTVLLFSYNDARRPLRSIVETGVLTHGPCDRVAAAALRTRVVSCRPGGVGVHAQFRQHLQRAGLQAIAV